MSASGQKKVELLGRKLRKLRKERKLSPEAVARRAGIDPRHLARIERGEARVGLEVLFRLLSVFQVDPGELATLARAESTSGDETERFRRELPG